MLAQRISFQQFQSLLNPQSVRLFLQSASTAMSLCQTCESPQVWPLSQSQRPLSAAPSSLHWNFPSLSFLLFTFYCPTLSISSDTVQLSRPAAAHRQSKAPAGLTVSFISCFYQMFLTTRKLLNPHFYPSKTCRVSYSRSQEENCSLKWFIQLLNLKIYSLNLDVWPPEYDFVLWG